MKSALSPMVVPVLAWCAAAVVCSAAAHGQDVDTPDAFYIINEDGTELRKLFDLPGFVDLGSPAVSPDGKTIAFDGWQAGENAGNSRIFTIAMDQTSLVELVKANMPSWSADGKYLTMSRSGVNPSGVWIASADGSQLEHVTSGWGAQWSPDGKTIAYTSGRQIVLYDVAGGDTRDVFPEGKEPYRQVLWNMTWSPDSKRLCFAGLNPDNSLDVAVVSLDDPDAETTVFVESSLVYSDFAWHPKGNRICFPLWHAELKRYQIYEFDPDAEDAPRLMEGQDTGKANTDLCWTPDGAQLIYVAR